MTGNEGTRELTGPTWHRFLSPHYDDVALSCGGTVARLARSGLTPEIVVVFGAEPDAGAVLSPFAARTQKRWGLTQGAEIAGRRREEAVAAVALGATSAALPFLDAIYRDRHYQDDEQLFGEVATAETILPAQIAAALALDALPDAKVRLYAPLAVGGHVDHRHGFAVGVSLARFGWDVWFYEDLPYALRAGALETRLAALAPGHRLEPAAIIDVTATWEAKLAAILAYPSQLATAFGLVGIGSSPEEIDRAMRAYALRAGGRVLAERFWRLAKGGSLPVA